MAEHLTQTVLNIDPQVFWGLVVVSGFGLTCVLVFGVLGAARVRQADPLVALKTNLGLKNFNTGLFLIGATLWGVVFGLLAFGLIWLIWDVIWIALPDTSPDTVEQDGAIWDWRFSLVKLTALVATLGAVVALPITMQRLWLSRIQTRTAADALFKDKINAAADDLHARRLVTKNPDEPENRWDYHQDDIVRRNAAIDRLEGLAIERPDIAPRIARMLSIYVRELSAENRAQEVPEEAMWDKVRDWARTLAQHRRSDMENAAQVLGWLQRIEGVDPEQVAINLRGANLQGFDLQGASLEKARLDGAQMQGADLGNTQLQHANLIGAQMQGAVLTGAQMQDANLSRVKMDASTILINSNFQAAVVRLVDFTDVALNQLQVDAMFGDGSVTLPAGLTRPDDWPQEDLEWEDLEALWRAWQEERGFGGG